MKRRAYTNLKADMGSDSQVGSTKGRTTRTKPTSMEIANGRNQPWKAPKGKGINESPLLEYKGSKQPLKNYNSKIIFSGESLPFGVHVSMTNPHLENSTCKFGQ